MPTKIVMTVEEGLTPAEVADLQYLLVDAIGEFASKRALPELYVVKRYAEAFSPKAMLDKIEQVRRRRDLAQKLHNPALAHEVEQHPLHTEVLLASIAMEGAERCRNAVVALQEVFGLTEEEARGAYNQLEDKRVSRMMAEQGLTTP
jgi:hypothetical protein